MGAVERAGASSDSAVGQAGRLASLHEAAGMDAEVLCWRAGGDVGGGGPFGGTAAHISLTGRSCRSVVNARRNTSMLRLFYVCVALDGLCVALGLGVGAGEPADGP